MAVGADARQGRGTGSSLTSEAFYTSIGRKGCGHPHLMASRRSGATQVATVGVQRWSPGDTTQRRHRHELAKGRGSASALSAACSTVFAGALSYCTREDPMAPLEIFAQAPEQNLRRTPRPCSGVSADVWRCPERRHPPGSLATDETLRTIAISLFTAAESLVRELGKPRDDPYTAAVGASIAQQYRDMRFRLCHV